MGVKLVYVKWLDAGAQYQKWRKAKDCDMRCELHSAGLLVSETEDVLTMAADYDANGKRYRDVASIPVSTIIEKRYFEVGGEANE